jgi:alpha-beta hydrolase superfamily lysophospholipase
MLSWQGNSKESFPIFQKQFNQGQLSKLPTSEFNFHSHGCEVYGFLSAPQTPKGVVVLVHGLGEHSGRYRENVIPVLLEAGLAVVTYDNIGHGKSSGKRGHCPSFDALLDILGRVIDKARLTHPDLPVFLYAHSMGGNLALNFVLRRASDIKGIVATSPYLRLAFQPPKWKMALGKWMLNVLPSITLPSGLDPNGISRIPKEVDKYKNDPLVHDKVSPMYSFPIMEAGEWAIKNANRLRVETLLLHGTVDPIIDANGTKEFHENSKRTTLKLFDGGFHELHYDLCSAQMLSSIQEWIKQRLV